MTIAHITSINNTITNNIELIATTMSETLAEKSAPSAAPTAPKPPNTTTANAFVNSKYMKFLPMSSTFPEFYNKLIENRSTLYPLLTIVLALIPVLITVGHSQISKTLKVTTMFIYLLLIIISIVFFRV